MRQHGELLRLALNRFGEVVRVVCVSSIQCASIWPGPEPVQHTGLGGYREASATLSLGGQSSRSVPCCAKNDCQVALSRDQQVISGPPFTVSGRIIFSSAKTPSFFEPPLELRSFSRFFNKQTILLDIVSYNYLNIYRDLAYSISILIVYRLLKNT